MDVKIILKIHHNKNKLIYSIKLFNAYNTEKYITFAVSIGKRSYKNCKKWGRNYKNCISHITTY